MQDFRVLVLDRVSVQFVLGVYLGTFCIGNNHIILLIFDNIFFSFGRKDQVPIAVSCDVCIEHQILFLHILLAWVEGGPNYLPNKVKSIRDLRKHGIYERGAHKHTIVFGMHDC